MVLNPSISLPAEISALRTISSRSYQSQTASQSESSHLMYEPSQLTAQQALQATTGLLRYPLYSSFDPIILFTTIAQFVVDLILRRPRTAIDSKTKHSKFGCLGAALFFAAILANLPRLVHSPPSPSRTSLFLPPS